MEQRLLNIFYIFKGKIYKFNKKEINNKPQLGKNKMNKWYRRLFLIKPGVSMF